MHALVKFIVFVIVGPILVGLLYFAVMKPAVTSATRQLTNTMQSQAAAAAERAKAQQRTGTANAPGAATDDTGHATPEAQAAQLRAESAAALAEQQKAARKEAAWQGFFKPKKICDRPPDWDTQVECGNAHIRAKRDFEERWARGEFQPP